jgi:hypothetical protein
MRIDEINVDIKEGRLLLRAVGLIMTKPGFTGNTPEEVLDYLAQERPADGTGK